MKMPKIITTDPFIDANGHLVPAQPASNGKRGQRPPPAISMSASATQFFKSFESNCQLECCGLWALSFSTPAVIDSRWNPAQPIEDEFAAVRREIEKRSAKFFHFPEIRSGLARTDALFLFSWLEYVIRQVRKQKSATP